MSYPQIIGLEFRIIEPSGRQRELKLFPFEHPYEPGTFFNVTVHTTNGDCTVDSRFQGSGPLR